MHTGKNMINSCDIAAAELLLCDADFPDFYVNMAHPEDYKLTDKAFVEYIPHMVGHHNRLIARVCWKISDNKYLPMSFVCDTGAPMGFYLSELATKLLKMNNRIAEDETGNEYTQIQDIGKVAIDPTPHGHTPANIMGLRVLTKVALHLCEDNTFKLTKIPNAF